MPASFHGWKKNSFELPNPHRAKLPQKTFERMLHFAVNVRRESRHEVYFGKWCQQIRLVDGYRLSTQVYKCNLN